jgi:RNA polymerase sigma-70 factor (ECF subfamily)
MSHDSSTPTRHTLLRRIKDWTDQKSWDEFFNTYSKLIFEFACNAGLNEAEAQDVVQETMTTVAKQIHEFQANSAHGSFKAWLLQLARWRVADQLRKRLDALAVIDSNSDSGSQTSLLNRVPDPASLNLDALWDANWRRNTLQIALTRLKTKVDPAQYQMFYLHVVKEWRGRQVAEKLGVKTAHVYFASYKISRLLKKEVKRLTAELERLAALAPNCPPPSI